MSPITAPPNTVQPDTEPHRIMYSPMEYLLFFLPFNLSHFLSLPMQYLLNLMKFSKTYPFITFLKLPVVFIIFSVLPTTHPWLQQQINIFQKYPKGMLSFPQYELTSIAAL